MKIKNSSITQRGLIRRVGLSQLLLVGGAIVCLATSYCYVLTPSHCLELGSKCTVGGIEISGKVVEASKTDRCALGCPGMTECGPDGTNMVDCTYTCRIGGTDYPDRRTKVQKYALGGTQCQCP
jgi:hypothetical protein